MGKGGWECSKGGMNVQHVSEPGCTVSNFCGFWFYVDDEDGDDDACVM